MGEGGQRCRECDGGVVVAVGRVEEGVKRTGGRWFVDCGERKRERW